MSRGIHEDPACPFPMRQCRQRFIDPRLLGIRAGQLRRSPDGFSQGTPGPPPSRRFDHARECARREPATALGLPKRGGPSSKSSHRPGLAASGRGARRQAGLGLRQGGPCSNAVGLRRGERCPTQRGFEPDARSGVLQGLALPAVQGGAFPSGNLGRSSPFPRAPRSHRRSLGRSQGRACPPGGRGGERDWSRSRRAARPRARSGIRAGGTKGGSRSKSEALPAQDGTVEGTGPARAGRSRPSRPKALRRATWNSAGAMAPGERDSEKPRLRTGCLGGSFRSAEPVVRRSETGPHLGDQDPVGRGESTVVPGPRGPSESLARLLWPEPRAGGTRVRGPALGRPNQAQPEGPRGRERSRAGIECS